MDAPVPDVAHGIPGIVPRGGFARGLAALGRVSAMPELNAIGIVASDLARSIAFYRLLGVGLPVVPGDAA